MVVSGKHPISLEELEEIIGKKITFEPEKGCWFIKEDWSVYTTIKGKRAHRFTYELCVAPLIKGLMICHNCDRPGCINPKHLYQGTAATNAQDATVRAKFPRVGIHIRSKHTKEYKEFKKLVERARWGKLVRFCGE